MPAPGVIEYFKTVADAIDIPIMVQDAPLSSTPLPTGLLIDQVALPGQVIPRGSTTVVKGRVTPSYQGWVSHQALQRIWQLAPQAILRVQGCGLVGVLLGTVVLVMLAGRVDKKPAFLIGITTYSIFTLRFRSSGATHFARGGAGCRRSSRSWWRERSCRPAPRLPSARGAATR